LLQTILVHGTQYGTTYQARVHLGQRSRPFPPSCEASRFLSPLPPLAILSICQDCSKNFHDRKTWSPAANNFIAS